MKVHTLRTCQTLPATPGAVFPFFADAGNLQRITPPWLHFSILTSLPIQMAVGTLIDYRIRIRGIPVRWRTRITVWEPPHRFVDEQVRGPYRLWVHEHTFREAQGGSEMEDLVRYASPGGGLIHRWLVRPELERIFAYRKEVLAGMFRSG